MIEIFCQGEDDGDLCELSRLEEERTYLYPSGDFRIYGAVSEHGRKEDQGNYVEDIGQIPVKSIVKYGD